jgi:hypothetical protein
MRAPVRGARRLLQLSTRVHRCESASGCCEQCILAGSLNPSAKLQISPLRAPTQARSGRDDVIAKWDLDGRVHSLLCADHQARKSGQGNMRYLDKACLA